MNVLALGARKLDHPEDILHEKVKRALQSLAPDQIISDYAYGWNLLVAQVAQEMGVSVIGAIPYAEIPAVMPPTYVSRRKDVEHKARTNTIFNQTAQEFSTNFNSYVDWVSTFSEEVLGYFPREDSSFSHSLMLSLSKQGKPVFNLYGGN